MIRFLLLILLLALGAGAQPMPGKITGKVTGKEGNPVSGATVHYRCANAFSGAGSKTTGPDGTYSIAIREVPDFCILTVNKAGYQTALGGVRIQGEEEVRNFVLLLEGDFTGPGVVTGTVRSAVTLRPVAGVQLVLRRGSSPAGNTERYDSVRTDAQGHYRFEGINLYVFATVDPSVTAGYRDHYAKAVLFEGATELTMDFDMEPLGTGVAPGAGGIPRLAWRSLGPNSIRLEYHVLESPLAVGIYLPSGRRLARRVLPAGSRTAEFGLGRGAASGVLLVKPEP